MLAVKVLRTAVIQFPERCCACGMDAQESTVRVVAVPRDRESQSNYMFERITLDVPMCRGCAVQRRLSWIAGSLSFVLLLTLLAAAIWLLGPLLTREAMTAVLIVGLGFLIATPMAIRRLTFRNSVAASFDEHWIVIGFDNRAYWEDFYELNRSSARLTED